MAGARAQHEAGRCGCGADGDSRCAGCRARVCDAHAIRAGETGELEIGADGVSGALEQLAYDKAYRSGGGVRCHACRHHDGLAGAAEMAVRSWPDAPFERALALLAEGFVAAEVFAGLTLQEVTQDWFRLARAHGIQPDDHAKLVVGQRRPRRTGAPRASTRSVYRPAWRFPRCWLVAAAWRSAETSGVLLAWHDVSLTIDGTFVPAGEELSVPLVLHEMGRLLWEAEGLPWQGDLSALRREHEVHAGAGLGMGWKQLAP